jgi:CubicO group peptidase (beta-lactamase class C family)
MSNLSAVTAMTPAMNWQSAAAGAQGFVAPGFEPVAEEFARNFTERGDVGAAFAVTHLGRPVLDLWGGEVAPGRRWAADSLLGVFSGTKGLLAGVMLKLIERGLLDLDQPVARYWPAFGAAGKEAIKVRHLVSHRSGVPGVRAPLLPADLSDAERIENLLAAQPTFDDPDAFLCYHALAIGWLCGGLVRAIDGRSLGRFFADEIAAPLGLETWIGLPETEEHRVGRFVFGDGMGGRWDAGLTEAQRADPVRRAVWANPPLFGDINHWDTRAFHAAEIGGAGGITTARAMARYYGCLAEGGTLDGVTLLAPDTIALGRRELSRFADPFVGEAIAFGVCWNLQAGLNRFGPPADAFGHTGAGGSIHGAWPTQRLGFSYVMNQLRADPEDQRTRPLFARLHQLVG